MKHTTKIAKKSNKKPISGFKNTPSKVCLKGAPRKKA